MAGEVKRDEIDYTIFVDRVQMYLAEIRGGCPGGEREALERTMRAYPGVTEDDVREWARDPDFRRVLKHAREMGDENRRWDAQQAALAQPDPFATPPRPGSRVDLAAETYTPDAPGGLRGWLRRLASRVTVEAQPTAPAAPAGQRFVSLEDAPPEAHWLAFHSADAQSQGRRGQAGQQADGTWTPPDVGAHDEPGLSPDGASWR